VNRSISIPESGPVELPTISAARQYLIPGQDTKGHAHRVYCRIMPAHYRAMCAVERERAFGFRTVGDVMRWCIDFGVRELAARAKSPQTRSALAQVDVMRQILLDEQYYMDYEQVFELMTTTVNRHLSAGAEQEAVRLITTVRHEIEAMTETYWREKYMKELMSRYGSYIDGSRIKAMDFGGDEVTCRSTVTRRGKPAPRKKGSTVTRRGKPVAKRASGKSRANSCVSGGAKVGKRTSDGGSASEQRVLGLLDRIDASLIRLGLDPL
jgi:hypothetical protein